MFAQAHRCKTGSGCTLGVDFQNKSKMVSLYVRVSIWLLTCYVNLKPLTLFNYHTYILII